MDGRFRDRLVTGGGALVRAWPWRPNLIVDELSRLLAALVKGDAQGGPLRWWAVGSGDPSWDSGAAPGAEVRRGWTALHTETGRKQIPPGRIGFVGGPLTNQLEITMQFTAADLPGGPATWSLREFGVFAGGPVGAGLLVNHRVHPRIDLQPGFTLERTLRLTF